MKRKRTKGLRHIEHLLSDAVNRFGTIARLFELAAASKFGKQLDPKRVRQALDRWASKHWLASWVRQFLYKRTYRKVPA